MENQELKDQETAEQKAETPKAEEATQEAGQAGNANDKSSASENKDGANSSNIQEDFKARYLYLMADFENYKRRAQREKESFIKYGNENILKDMIAVVDNFDLTIDALKHEQDEKVKSIVVGIEMVKKQYMDVLGKHGLTVVKSVGEIFDPNIHEAVGQQIMEDKQDHEIIQQYQAGYLLNGRLLRAAKVVIARTQI